VIDGPFAETKELIAGLSGLWAGKVDGRGDSSGVKALPPVPMKGEAEIEIRQVFEGRGLRFRAYFPELRDAGKSACVPQAAAKKAVAATVLRLAPAEKEVARHVDFAGPTFDVTVEREFTPRLSAPRQGSRELDNANTRRSR